MKRARLIWLIGMSGLLLISQHAQNSALAGQPTLTLRIAENRTRFQMGEIVPIVLKFASDDPGRYSIDLANYDRSGRMDIDKFHLTPKPGWSDPLAFYYESGLFAFMGGGIRAVPPLGPAGQEIDLNLNEWVRFDRPGHYSLSVSSDRVIMDKKEKSFGRKVELTSNVVELEIVPADEKWASEQVAIAATELRSTNREVAMRGARTMRFLGTKNAAALMVEQYNRVDDGRDGEFEFGLLGSAHREFIAGEMRNELERADHPIDSSFVHLLAALAFELDHPDPLPELPQRTDVIDDAALKQIRSQMKERKNAFNPYLTETLSKLASTIPQRKGRALAQAYTTILKEGSEAGTFETPAFAGFREEVRNELPTVFSTLPKGDQDSLLAFWWSDIRSDAMLPVLMAKYKAAPRDFIRGELIQLIADLNPQQARDLLLDDLEGGEPSLLYDQGDVFGKAPLPDLEDTLLRNMRKAEESQPSGMRAYAILIERHATARISPQVEAIYGRIGNSEGDGAGAFLLAYLLRTDFDYARRAIEEQDGLCRQTDTLCSGLAPNVLAMAMAHGESDRIEDLAIARMQSEDDPIVARDGAEALKEHGTTKAEAVLWKRLELWHERWSGEEELLGREENRVEANLGRALIEAIAKGNGWLADASKLRRLESLCISTEQREEVKQMEAAWKDGPKLEIIVFSHNDFWPHLAQYEYQTLESIWPKLAQFPSATVLRFSTSSDVNERKQAVAIGARVEQFAKEHQLLLEVETEE